MNAAANASRDEDLLVSIPNDAGLAAAIGEVPGARLVTWDLDGPPPHEAFDIVMPPYWGGPRRLARLEGVQVRLVQWQSIGYDRVADYLPEGIPLANAASVHEASTAELAIALALVAQRGIADFVRSGDRGVWERPAMRPSLADRRVLIVGYGGVGKAIDARLVGFETSVTRIARTARSEAGPGGEPVPVLGMDRLHEALAEAEIVIVGVPLDAGTRGLIDAAALAAMPDGALLVNVARGAVVDTDALMAELNSGRLRAALDVTDPEPLPEGHPLWSCPGLIVSPHVGGDSTAYVPRMARLLHRQVERMRRGEHPENLVDLSR
ncbi:MAG: hydroxyacid dehydrogenase [Candidatus Leucobacter sulfamidivorax]|nr:hydroxyacid dehydrogenase [Candidatus Leucobacter sulfamidivorax]